MAKGHPTLTEQQARALPYWQAIEAAAAGHVTTSELWGLIRAQADEYGLESPGVGIVGVSQLRALAGQIQGRAAEFAQLRDSRILAGRYWTPAPWAREPAARAAAPRYQVRFEHTVTRNGEQVTEWRTTTFEGRAPRTTGELRDLVADDAIQIANKYGGENIGTDNLQLLTV